MQSIGHVKSSDTGTDSITRSHPCIETILECNITQFVYHWK